MHSVQTRSIASSQDVPQSQNAPAAADVKYVEEVQVDGVERADSKVTEQSAASSVPSSSPSPPTPPSGLPPRPASPHTPQSTNVGTSDVGTSDDGQRRIVGGRRGTGSDNTTYKYQVLVRR